MTRADRIADAAAERARRAKPGQRIRLQTIAQHLRLKALAKGTSRDPRTARRARARAA